MRGRISKTSAGIGRDGAVIIEFNDGFSFAAQLTARLQNAAGEKKHLAKSVGIIGFELDGDASGTNRVFRWREESDSTIFSVVFLVHFGIEVEMRRQKCGGASGQSISAFAVGHEIIILFEVVEQSKGVSQFMRRFRPVKRIRN